MDSNDFIFSDDVAESLGSRVESDGHSAESGDSPETFGKSLPLLGTLGFAVMNLMAFLDHPTRL